MSEIFTYGTLKKGFRAHNLLTDSHFLCSVKTHPRYHIYEIGGFPGMVVGNDDGGVQGELYEVSDEVIEALDGYEGVPDLFTREQIELESGTIVWAYIFARSVTGRQEIKDGVWK